MLTLPAELTIAEVSDFKSHFIEYIDAHDEIVFDASDLTRIDTVGIQLVLSGLLYIAAQKKSYIWHKQSSIIYQSIKQLGMNGFAF